MMRKYIAIGTACAALALAGCDGGKAVKTAKAPTALDSISMDSLIELAKKNIFFGHQSVGLNIIDGLKDAAREKGWAGFNIIEARTSGVAPGFYHAGIGTNGDPLGKIADFEAIMRGEMAGKIDIALMKFCYIDIAEGTDVDAVFASYRDAMKRLDAEYPGTTFVRATVPLETRESGLKALAKRILGRATRDEANIARRRINDMIRAECSSGDHPLFDIARIESAAADGSYVELIRRGQSYSVLRDEYSSDGGHLNEKGRLAAAIELVSVLSASEN
jgi:hypothetical protein